MNRLVAAILAVSILALAPSAAAARVPTGKYRTTITSGFLKGKWTFNFFAKNRYKITGPFGSLTGRLKYDGSKVTFYGESEGTACPGKGLYRYKLTGSTLKITTIKEPCKVRAMVQSRTWRKVT